MTGLAILQRLFSRATIVFFFLLLIGLLGASFVTYLQDRHLQSISLGALRMASWNLAQLGNEASAFDREMALAAVQEGDLDDLLLRYDILWSRYDYLLHSAESAPTRQHQDNERRLGDLFGQLKAMEADLLALTGNDRVASTTLAAQWAAQKEDIEKLVIDNFVGDETGQLMASVESSRDRLSTLRLITFSVLVGLFLYLAVAMVVLRRQARRDPVTGLPNARSLETLKVVNPACVVAAVEINRFQVTLSELGTEVSNALTRRFAEAIRASGLPLENLIQISQSEFLMMAALPRGMTVEDWAEKLCRATTFQWSLEEMVIGVSGILGIDPLDPSGETGWQTRYQRAHRALIQARLDGCRYHINEDSLRRRMQEERVLQQGLVRFLGNGEGTLSLHLVYQPTVRVPDKESVVGVEVLLRCHEQSLGWVPPNRVVDLCERYGLGLELGRWLFSAVAAEAGTLYRDMDFRGSVSINLNPAMLGPTLLDDVQHRLINGGLPGDCLLMEITEDNAALDFRRINEMIDQLHPLGVRFALDDFGTGHSSLEYVRELRVDRIKIDRCFVTGIENSDDRCRFLGSIIAMAQQAYMKCVIEGVENQTQWELTAGFGDVLVQGFYAYRPMPFSDLKALLQANHGELAQEQA